MFADGSVYLVSQNRVVGGKRRERGKGKKRGKGGEKIK